MSFLSIRLKTNLSKLEFFTAGIYEDQCLNFSKEIGITMGKLPVKYLEVPLITTKLSLSKCQPMLDKLLSKIKSWVRRKLTYADRLTLAKSILNSMFTGETFFVLPKVVIRKVERTLSAFLWCGTKPFKHKNELDWSMKTNEWKGI